jgi:hypothetical protein
MEDTDLTRIVQFAPAFERMEEGVGRGSARCWFCLRGPKGAVTFSVSTGWYLPESRAAIKALGYEPGGGEGGAVTTHATWPYRDFLEETRCDECDWLDRQPCYGDVGYLAGEEFFVGLVKHGDEALWALLKTWYDEIPEKPDDEST